MSNDVRAPVGDMPVRAYGKYLLVRKLAEGGMAEIFLAKQVGVEGFERNVVIKRMLPHLSETPDFVKMFLDEARLASGLTHPNVVQLTDLGHADGCYYICMEYLAGEDFATVLRTHRRRNEHMPLKMALRIVADAALGLHYAHESTDSNGQPTLLVHRDVSPSNIFITYSGQVKVLDFGIAKAESRASTTSAGVVKGKYLYMSPEQAGGAPVDRRSDVFSLGVTLYEALTGTRPFEHDTDLAILRAVLESNYRPLRELRPDLPSDIDAMVTRAMSVFADDRHATALAFVQDIERFMGSTTSSGGARMLADYMVGTFGKERVESKTRIETLEELVRRGVEVPGRDNPKAPDTDPNHTRVVAPASVVVDRSRSVVQVGLVLSFFLLAVAATVLVLRSGNTPVLPVAPDSGAAVVVVPPVDHVPEPLDAGVAELDAGQPEVTVPDAGRAVAKPIVLTTAIVQRAIGQNKGRFQRCFTEHRDDLPGRSGAVLLTFVIASTGRVSEATTDLPLTSGASKCLTQVVKTISFPRNVDQGVRVPISLSYDLP